MKLGIFFIHLLQKCDANITIDPHLSKVKCKKEKL